MNVLNEYKVSHELLKIPKEGSFLEHIAIENSYYGAFKKFLETERYEDFAPFLSLSYIESATIFRANVIKLMNTKKISYGDALSLYEPNTNFLSNIDEAVKIVMDNYISMLKARENYKIECIIDDFGNILIHEGIHRSIINHCNGYPDSECQIIERSVRWLDIHRLIQSDGVSLYKSNKRVYQRILHPDFGQYTPIREDRYFEIYKTVSDLQLTSGLDLGCQFGQNSLYLVSKGVEMKLFEYEKKYYEAALTLGGSYSNYSIEFGNMLEVDFSQYSNYQFVLMTSLLYHLLRNDFNTAVRFLNHLKVNFDYFVIDTENRTGILPDSLLLDLMSGFESKCVYKGGDDRNLYFFNKINKE